LPKFIRGEFDPASGFTGATVTAGRYNSFEGVVQPDESTVIWQIDFQGHATGGYEVRMEYRLVNDQFFCETKCVCGISGVDKVFSIRPGNQQIQPIQAFGINFTLIPPFTGSFFPRFGSFAPATWSEL